MAGEKNCLEKSDRFLRWKSGGLSLAGTSRFKSAESREAFVVFRRFCQPPI